MVRFKNRYIAVEVNPLGQSSSKPFALKGSEFYKVVLEGVQKLHGDFGVAAISQGYAAKYCNEVTRIALLRTRHGPHRLLASTLPFVTHVGKTPITLRIIYTGTTLKRCFLYLQRHQRAALDKVWSNLKNDQERCTLEAAIMDLSVVENFQLSKEQREAMKTVE